MTDALILGDVHLSDNPPVSRRASYTEEILDKLRFCVEEANRLDLPIVQAGDMFHIKAPSRTSHRLVQQTHEVLRECLAGVWVAPGNHDLQHDRLESLDAQPLGALGRMEGMHLLLGSDPELPGIAGVPYLNAFEDAETWRAAAENWAGHLPEEIDLLVTHASIFPPGSEPGVYYSIPPAEWAEVFAGIPNCYYGHIHECHGTYEVNGMTFCNQGALSRGSLHEETIKREPAVTLWVDGKFSRLEVPHLPASEVFLFVDAQLKKEQAQYAEAFAASLAEVSMHGLSIEDVKADLRARTDDKKVLHIAETCLEEAQ